VIKQGGLSGPQKTTDDGDGYRLRQRCHWEG
jgi:hypothetical protein